MANNEDIDFGQMSEALNDKLDRDGRNVDTVSGADVVIEYQLPTADNNYTWYRLYKSGWVEQGGISEIPSRINSGESQTTIIFPKSMSNSSYSAQMTFQNGGAFYANSQLTFRDKSTSNVKLEFYVNATGTTGTFPVCWEVKGMSAQS